MHSTTSCTCVYLIGTVRWLEPQKEEKGGDATVSERLAAEQDAGSYLNQPQSFFFLLF